jgi:serine/threonine protein kinase
MAIPLLGNSNPIDTLLSKIPTRFHVEISRKRRSSREAEFARIRETFKNYLPAIVIEDYIGSGGFADVFKVRSYYNGITDFVIKILRSDLIKPHRRRNFSLKQEEMRIKDVKKRFTNESYVQWHLSQSLSQAVAESVVKVYDHGEFDRKTGYRFLLMEQMGHTVRQFIAEVDHTRGDRDILRYKLDMMINIATIIDNVHKEGIFHRDIKPENILFTRLNEGDPSVRFAGSEKAWPERPSVKLGDFGTVRWVRSYSDKYDAIIIGSQYYMSPEQILDPRNLDPRTDIYSFGIVCYELLFGIHPIHVNTGEKNFLEKIAFSKPVPREPPEGCAQLNGIIMQCMEEISKRYQFMEEVVHVLKRCRDS